MQHDPARRPSIAVIGGGIGGLTAAACLLHSWILTCMFTNKQTGLVKLAPVVINIGPNASRILHRLGIAEELNKAGVKPASLDQRRWDDGRVLLRSPLGEEVEAVFGAPYYTLHRRDLHRALVDVIPAERSTPRTPLYETTGSRRSRRSLFQKTERLFRWMPLSGRMVFTRPYATALAPGPRKTPLLPAVWPIVD